MDLQGSAPREGQKARRLRRAKADLKWCVLIYLGCQLAFIAVMDNWLPKFYDQEYGVRLELLRERMAEAPDRPLLLVVGSSRVEMGFRPEVLPPLTSAAGETVLPFNYSHLAAVSRGNLMMVDRLLRQQIRPRWIVLEMVPRFLGCEKTGMATTFTTGWDLPLLQKYVAPYKLWSVYLRNRLNPWYKYRQDILSLCASAWVSACPQDFCTLDPLGGDTGWVAERALSEAERRRRLFLTHHAILQDFQTFNIEAATDAAVRALLDRCRQHGIQVVLLQTPESQEYRDWHPPHVRAQSEAYLARISQDYGLPVVDARTWVPDSMFADGHHLMVDGAEFFSRRLGQEVLEPLVQGRLACPAKAPTAPTP